MSAHLFERILQESNAEPGLTRKEYERILSDPKTEEILSDLHRPSSDLLHIDGPAAGRWLEQEFGKVGRIFYEMYWQEQHHADEPETWRYYFRDEPLPKELEPHATITHGVPKQFIDSANRHFLGRG
jgi:hypothetical protein